jgi:hypothetical protein
MKTDMLLLTPRDLAQDVPIKALEEAQYNWKDQSRGDPTRMGKYTFGSIQTFDPRGNPKDSQNDNND